MIKKIILFLIILAISFWWNTYWLEYWDSIDPFEQSALIEKLSPQDIRDISVMFDIPIDEVSNNLSDWKYWPITKFAQETVANKAADKRDAAMEELRNDPDSLLSPKFMINTAGLWIWPKNSELAKEATAKETVDSLLNVIVNALMIAFWVLALFIMTIGWGYMIFAAGQDELLNKWKSIFSAWLISLLIALWSWIIMKTIIFLLY